MDSKEANVGTRPPIMTKSPSEETVKGAYLSPTDQFLVTSTPNTNTTTTITTIAETANNAATNNITPTTSSTNCDGPVVVKSSATKPRFHPYSKPNPILLSGDRRSRKRKSLTWQSEEKIQKVHFFEYIADERVNVTRITNNADQQSDTNASANVTAGSSPNANNKLPNAVGAKISNASVDGKAESDNKYVEYMPWRSLILIDLTPELPSPGWNSIERSAQAERESYVLGAIDLPGQPSTLDEPDTQTATNKTSTIGGTNESGTKDGATDVKIIPTVNPEGMYTEYSYMYNSEIVNGVKTTSDNFQTMTPNILALCNQQSQMLPNPFQQQQLVHATQNPFNFQDMVAQFQLQAQMQIQFPFQQQQQ